MPRWSCARGRSRLLCVASLFPPVRKSSISPARRSFRHRRQSLAHRLLNPALERNPQSFVPQIRALAMLDPNDPRFKQSLSGGVTTVVTGTGSGEVSSGEAERGYSAFYVSGELVFEHRN